MSDVARFEKILHNCIAFTKRKTLEMSLVGAWF